MNKKNGINKVNTNVKSSNFGINQNIKYLSQKNYKKAKINSTTNKIKKTNSPKNLNNQETKIRNPYYPIYPGINERGKTKISQSVNILNDDYNNLNYYYNNDNTTVKPKSKKDSKKTSVFTNNKKNEEKEKLKKNQRLNEEERKKKEKEKEKEKERELRLLEEEKKKEKIEKDRIEKERREKELLEKEKEKERKRQKEKEEREKFEKEKLEIEKKERLEREKKEKIEKEKEEKRIKEILFGKKEKESDNVTFLNTKKESEKNGNPRPPIGSATNESSEISSIYKSKIGLRNLGNTCFMNTCLQNLIHSEFFIIKLFSKSSLLSSKTKISKQFYSLCKEVSSCITSSFSPYDFKSAFGSKHSMFSGYNQHDTQEFCRILLEDMNSELNEVLNPAPYKELSTLNKSKIECNKEFDEVFRKRENSLIMDTFYGQLINIFKCECDFETYSFEKILDLPLLLQKHSSSIDIKDLLKDYFECERIKFETKCEKCKKKEWHTKEIKISQPPNILILSLQRQNPRTGSKNNSYVKFYDNIDMSEYLDHECWNKNDAKYSLYGIGNHSGSINFGHYYAYIKINNTWYEFNDSSVSTYSKGDDNSSSTAYVLFYKKNNI
jgi:ubiquitin C-terminal hydrolase